MKIELDTPSPGRNVIQSYSAAGIIINNVPYRNSIIVCPDRIIGIWAPHRASELDVGHFQQIIELSPELILIGTGDRLQFPDPAIVVALQSCNIGIEVMDTAAACRAYNFLAGENRQVVAALIGFGN